MRLFSTVIRRAGRQPGPPSRNGARPRSDRPRPAPRLLDRVRRRTALIPPPETMRGLIGCGENYHDDASSYCRERQRRGVGPQGHRRDRPGAQSHRDRDRPRRGPRVDERLSAAPGSDRSPSGGQLDRDRGRGAGARTTASRPCSRPAARCLFRSRKSPWAACASPTVVTASPRPCASPSALSTAAP